MTANVLLVADDMPNNLSVMRTMISKYLPGCELITATGAEEGLTMAADANVDAVLLDVQMAKMTGIEMCRQLKSNERTADLPVILVTPRRTPSKLKAEGLEAGADDFLSKPIDGIELVAKIKAALRLKHTGTRVPEIADHPDRPVAEKTGAIVQQERMIRSVLASMQDDVLLIDRDYQIVDVNESALATIEKKREEVIGRRCHEVYHGLHGPCSEHGRPCLLPTVLSTGEPARYQEVITRSDGSEIHVDTLLSPLIDDQGDVDSVVLVGRDVTALVENVL